MRLELVTAPTVEPLTLADAKAHLRVTVTDEDALITRLIGAARRQVESTTRRKLVTQHWRIYFDGFPWSNRINCRLWPQELVYFSGYDLVLPDVAPVSAIDSVKYIDINGTLQTLASSVYQLVPEARPRVTLAYNQDWPDLRGDREGVRVEVTCGYGAAAAVPEDIKAAMLLIVGHLYEQREDVTSLELYQIPSGVQVLLSPYIVPAF